MPLRGSRLYVDVVTRLFVTGKLTDQSGERFAELVAMNAMVELRRMVYDDLRLNSESTGDVIRKWYGCTGAALRNTLLGWLSDRNLISETFNLERMIAQFADTQESWC
ncbi:hypothetical protein DL95DRAFT_399492 [Leptodontidium sp. 2 PMI_412]|nr:hypothetical protein DL95DRAFT_399492 [Leptodontidium sp. 2 PMI_412]